MAEEASVPHMQSSFITPVDVLSNIVAVINKHVGDIAIPPPFVTNTSEALKRLDVALTNSQRHRQIVLHKIKTPEQIKALQKLAREYMPDSSAPSAQSSGPLSIRNVTSSSKLPIPSPPTPAQNRKLKENFPPPPDDNEPFFFLRAKLDEGKLASLPGTVNITAMDYDPNDRNTEEIVVSSDFCLWDTGASICVITDDLIRAQSTTFLDDKIHDPYRGSRQVSVQVSGYFCFSNSIIRIDAPFHIMEKESLPNKRSGIILGQHGMIDRMEFQSIPKVILESRGEVVKENEWGDINMISYIDTFDEVIQF